MKGIICKGERVLSGFTSPASLAGGVDKHYFNLEHSGKVEVSAAAYFAAMDVVQSQITKEPQGHPHAELMAQYAEVAKTNPKPWEEFQAFGTGSQKWLTCTSMLSFEEGIQYRRKPKTKLIHGVEVPDITFTPNEGDFICVPSPCFDGFISTPKFYNDKHGEHHVKHNLCYPDTEEGKQAAILHAKAMLGIA